MCCVSLVFNLHCFPFTQSALESSETNLPADQKRLLAKYTLFGRLNGMELPTNKYDNLVMARKGTLEYQNTYNNKLAVSNMGEN